MLRRHVSLLFISIILIGHSHAYADKWCTEIGYFDTDNIEDILRYDCTYSDVREEDYAVKVEFTLTSADNRKKTVHRTYLKADQPNIRITQSSEKGEIVIYEAGVTASSDLVSSYYRYNEQMDDWYLRKSVVRQYTPQRTSPAAFNTKYFFDYFNETESIEGKKIDAKNANIEAESDRTKKMHKTLSSIHNELMRLYRSKEFDQFPEYTTDYELFAELIYNIPITLDTAELYNNIGFILGFTKEQAAVGVAQYILEEVTKKVTDRTPAHLNLADVYTTLGDIEKSIPEYEKYVRLMKNEGNENKIPQRVIDKLSTYKKDRIDKF